MNLIQRMWWRLLDWKWDRDYHAAVERAHRCAHKRTIFVDVGITAEKCCDCWALRLPKLGGSPLNEIDLGEMEWIPNSANPRYARQVSPPDAKKAGLV